MSRLYFQVLALVWRHLAWKCLVFQIPTMRRTLVPRGVQSDGGIKKTPHLEIQAVDSALVNKKLAIRHKLP